MYSIVRGIALSSALLLSPSAVLGAAPEPSSSARPQPLAKAQTSITHHTARIGGRSFSYTATAGTIELDDTKDEPTASVFYVAYTANDGGPTARRPLTFAYNGGPGGSSALIHMGALGPRVVVTTNAAATPPAPYDIIDNADSLLDTSDLVFVDAVGTGFSRIAGRGTPKDFYGVDQDGRAFEQFVRRYLTTNDRWNSPKYLAGESYGTTRSVVLANMLQNDGIVINGITLISTVLDFSTLIAQAGNDLPYWLFLPSEAAVAAYHHKISANEADGTFLRAVRAFAEGPFMTALAKGADLAPAERDAIAQQLHNYTGLPIDYLVRSQLRVDPNRFEQQLLSGTDETVGRYDGRFRHYDRDPIAAGADSDPSSDAVFGAFTASFNRYLRDELHYVTDANYEFLSRDVNRQWQWHRDDNGSPSAVNVCTDLRDTLTANPYLRVFSANGIYDLATPFFATEYSLAHLGLNPALRAHITFGYYPAGHMIYLNPVARAELKADLARFYHLAPTRALRTVSGLPDTLLDRRENVQKASVDQIFRALTVRGHVRGRHMRAQRVRAGPLLDDDERIRTEFRLDVIEAAGIDGRGVFDAAGLGVDVWDVRLKYGEHGITPPRFRGDDGYQMKHPTLFARSGRRAWSRSKAFSRGPERFDGVRVRIGARRPGRDSDDTAGPANAPAAARPRDAAWLLFSAAHDR